MFSYSWGKLSLGTMIKVAAGLAIIVMVGCSKEETDDCPAGITGCACDASGLCADTNATCDPVTFTCQVGSGDADGDGDGDGDADGDADFDMTDAGNGADSGSSCACSAVGAETHRDSSFVHILKLLF